MATKYLKLYWDQQGHGILTDFEEQGQEQQAGVVIICQSLLVNQFITVGYAVLFAVSCFQVYSCKLYWLYFRMDILLCKSIASVNSLHS